MSRPGTIVVLLGALLLPGALLVWATPVTGLPGRSLLLGIGLALSLLAAAGLPRLDEGEAAVVLASWTWPGMAALVSLSLGWGYLALAPVDWWGAP